jgi:hypothetical protein
LISRRVEPCVDWGTIVGGVKPRVDRARIGWLDWLSVFFVAVNFPVGLASSRSRIRNVHPPCITELVRSETLKLRLKSFGVVVAAD